MSNKTFPQVLCVIYGVYQVIPTILDIPIGYMGYGGYVGYEVETIHSAAWSCPVVSTVTATVTLNLNPLPAHTCSQKKNIQKCLICVSLKSSSPSLSYKRMSRNPDLI